MTPKWTPLNFLLCEKCDFALNISPLRELVWVCDPQWPTLALVLCSCMYRLRKDVPKMES